MEPGDVTEESIEDFIRMRNQFDPEKSSMVEFIQKVIKMMEVETESEYLKLDRFLNYFKKQELLREEMKEQERRERKQKEVYREEMKEKQRLLKEETRVKERREEI